MSVAPQNANEATANAVSYFVPSNDLYLKGQLADHDGNALASQLCSCGHPEYYCPRKCNCTHCESYRGHPTEYCKLSSIPNPSWSEAIAKIFGCEQIRPWVRFQMTQQHRGYSVNLILLLTNRHPE